MSDLVLAVHVLDHASVIAGIVPGDALNEERSFREPPEAFGGSKRRTLDAPLNLGRRGTNGVARKSNVIAGPRGKVIVERRDFRRGCEGGNMGVNLRDEKKKKKRFIQELS
jgi:hypothetical protein